MKSILSVGFAALLAFSCSSSSDQTAEEKAVLLISDGSEYQPNGSYPRFSWETVPMYYMFGNSDAVLSQDELEFIAGRTDFLTIEKSHGLKTLGAAELGARHDAAAFKAIKPDMKVLFYFNSAYAWPFTSYNKNFTWETIDDYPELKSMLITDPETGKLANRRDVFFFDVLNPDLREWWVDKVVRGVETCGCDGAFIDQMHGFAWLRPDSTTQVHQAMGKMMGDLKARLGPGKILLANNATDDIARFVYPVMDANMFEHYNSQRTSKENFLKEWDDMLRLAKDGKMSIFRIGVEVEDRVDKDVRGEERHKRLAKLSKERLEFYLASYLIGAQPYSYFQYGWGWTLASGALIDYPDFQRPLGAPLGPYKRTTPNGWEFTREFGHASVWVNTETREGKITWKK